ncbi:NADPH-dependent FMN reductase [Ancylobacter lacus]|uniref:NADPH-dependent FMN reductase n=1 Tax=Ancylobacter lacus TaxID=2579970 RepID=UPI001BCB9FDE|nr:NAD(P)H-dependent oxidoreductase [Ancylobacter lacus]MBS7539621.1 NAD(P)H-dependent oxidoreductase [Ancylobacter lacus]
MAPKILTFAGSTRHGAFSGQLAAAALHELAELGAEAELLSLADYDLPIYNGDLETEAGVPEAAVALNARLGAADGIFVVTPEYNAGVPPLLKNAIDWASRARGPRDPFKGPVWAIGASSPGAMGGYRAAMMLRQVLALGLGALVLGGQVSIGGAGQAFGEDGRLKDERLARLLRGVLADLVAEAGRRAAARA